jgi:hypothetical protein
VPNAPLDCYRPAHRSIDHLCALAHQWRSILSTIVHPGDALSVYPSAGYTEMVLFSSTKMRLKVRSDIQYRGDKDKKWTLLRPVSF